MNTATADYTAKPTHVGFWTALTGGTWLGGDEITNVSSYETPVDTTTIEFPVQGLEIEVPDGELTSNGAIRCTRGFVDGTIYISLHSADPGNTGANELSATGGYARIAVESARWITTAV